MHSFPLPPKMPLGEAQRRFNQHLEQRSWIARPGDSEMGWDFNFGCFFLLIFWRGFCPLTMIDTIVP